MNFDTEKYRSLTTNEQFYLSLLANPALIRVLSILRRFLTLDNHKMAEENIKVFATSEENEQAFFPPPFTLLNNKTKANAVSMLSTLWAPNYSSSVHFFIEWIQWCEPISHARRVLIHITNQDRAKEESRFKRYMWEEKYLNYFLKIFSFLMHGKRYQYKSYMEQSTII